MKPLFLIPILAGLALVTACKPDPIEPDPDPQPADERLYTPEFALKAKATYPVGTAVQAGRISQNAYSQLITKEFNSLTAEYEMKQNIVHTGPDTYNWAPVDAIVNYAVANGIRVHGHALLWHSAVPNWLNSFSGTDAEFDSLMKRYIQTYVGRYKGKVASWDVVNEAFEDGTGAYRNTIYRQRMGADYIAKCFQWAHEADPDAKLFYNDYGAEYDATKRGAIVTLINDLKARGVPIHGFGFQMHINHNWPSLSTLTTAVEALKNTGLLIHFSELDVRANPDGDLTDLTVSRAQSQEDRYREIAALHKSLPAAQQFGITVWGIKDDESWLISFWGNPEWALLFDKNFKYKLAHRGMVAGF
ncbi:MAG: endo-1,4-beta-xylanase [Bacteroidia bacterium]|nr:endo-1,4-beta-xylanase [Bacteroidia bacterium]